MTDLRQKKNEDLVAQAKAAFASHEIVARGFRPLFAAKDAERPLTDDQPGLGWWLLRKRSPDGHYPSEYWCEITEGYGGHLHVGGDITSVVFAHYPTHPDQLPGTMVRWMGRKPFPSSYVCEKARIGSSYDGVAWAYDHNVAVADFEAWLRERHEDDPDRAPLDPDTIRSAKRGLADGDPPHIAMEHMPTAIAIDSEIWGTWGRVLSPSVVFAWAALNRLAQILDEVASSRRAAEQARHDEIERATKGA